MRLKLRVRKEYKKYAKGLKDAHEKIKAGDYSSAMEVMQIAYKILGNYEAKIEKLWDKYPGMSCMGFKFELNDVFLGKNHSSVIKEAEQKYEGKNFEPLLDYVINRHPSVLI